MLRPIETAPRDGSYVLVAGPSGHSTTPLRFEACRYDPEYRPLQPWVNHANDGFMDGGEGPTHWMPLPGDWDGIGAVGEITVPLRAVNGSRFNLVVSMLEDYNVHFELRGPASGQVIAEHLAIPGDVAHEFMNVLGLRPWDHQGARSPDDAGEKEEES